MKKYQKLTIEQLENKLEQMQIKKQNDINLLKNTKIELNNNNLNYEKLLKLITITRSKLISRQDLNEIKEKKIKFLYEKIKLLIIVIEIYEEEIEKIQLCIDKRNKKLK